jgi:hypothetical protein
MKKSDSWESDEPYTEPADPWGDQDAAWGGHPMSGAPGAAADTYGSAVYGASVLNEAPPAWPQAPPPRRRNTAMLTLVVVLAVFVVGGAATAVWLVTRGHPAKPGAVAAPSTVPTSAGVLTPEPATSEDGRFVRKGQCVRNEGTAQQPEMRIVGCTTGTYEVLKRIDGRTTGQADAETKCAKVPHYTKWYFYDSELDSLDFVLCLRER